MRRLFLLLALLAAVLAGCVIYARTRADRWRALPDGGEIRWLSVTYENPPAVHFKTKESFLAPFWKRLGPKWRSRFAEKPFEVGGSLDEPALFVWFQLRGVKNDPLSQDTPYSLVQGDQLVRWKSAFGSTRADGQLVGVGFTTPLGTQPRLKVRWSGDQQVLDFDMANPFYQPAKNAGSETK